ncbi:MAG TPA: ferredoxin FdxA [Burkholderiaceae bacterium]|nr:ferredoxin FdxA [Burkholderiaceae bacterium]
MTHVVTESCINCRYSDCVAVCPVECFHQGPNFMVIDPDGCIDCGVCIPECPVEAIVEEAQVPADQRGFIALNAERARHWPLVTAKSDPLPDAERWAKEETKLALLVADAVS